MHFLGILEIKATCNAMVVANEHMAIYFKLYLTLCLGKGIMEYFLMHPSSLIDVNS